MSKSVLSFRTVGVLLACALTLSIGSAGLGLVRTSEAGSGVVCADSFARWQSLAGHWEGIWTNHTFNSNGTLTADVTISPDCTAQVVVQGIFMQPGAKTINASYHDSTFPLVNVRDAEVGNNAATVVDVQNDAIFGDTTIVIQDNGALTFTGTGLHQAIESVTGMGDVSNSELNLDIEMKFVGGGTADETIHATKEVTETPTPIPTPEPTATPTPTPTPSGLVQGNVDCNSSVNSVDSLKVLRFVAQLSVSQELGCPLIGTEVASFWGDVDCSGTVNSVDALKILRYVAQLTVQQAEPCPDVGMPVGN